MRTYSHTILTYTAIRRLGAPAANAAPLAPSSRTCRPSPARPGSPRGASRVSPAGNSTIPPVALAALVACLLPRRGKTHTALLPLLFGWASHVAADALTHGSNARPLLWPVSDYRFKSPLSYHERDRHALPFTVAEHAAVLAALPEATAGIAGTYRR